MSLLFVSRSRRLDPVAAGALSLLREATKPGEGPEDPPVPMYQTRVIGSGEVAPENSVVFLTRAFRSDERNPQWYARIYDMRNAEHIPHFNEPWLQKAAFVVVVRQWNSSKKRFEQCIRRIPRLADSISENRLRAAA